MIVNLLYHRGFGLECSASSFITIASGIERIKN